MKAEKALVNDIPFSRAISGWVDMIKIMGIASIMYIRTSLQTAQGGFWSFCTLFPSIVGL